MPAKVLIKFKFEYRVYELFAPECPPSILSFTFIMPRIICGVVAGYLELIKNSSWNYGFNHTTAFSSSLCLCFASN